MKKVSGGVGREPFLFFVLWIVSKKEMYFSGISDLKKRIFFFSFLFE